MTKKFTYDTFINNMVLIYGLDFLRLNQNIKDFLYKREIACMKVERTNHREVFMNMGTALYLFNTYKLN